MALTHTTCPLTVKDSNRRTKKQLGKHADRVLPTELFPLLPVHTLALLTKHRLIGGSIDDLEVYWNSSPNVVLQVCRPALLAPLFISDWLPVYREQQGVYTHTHTQSYKEHSAPHVPQITFLMSSHTAALPSCRYRCCACKNKVRAAYLGDMATVYDWVVLFCVASRAALACHVFIDLDKLVAAHAQEPPQARKGHAVFTLDGAAMLHRRPSKPHSDLALVIAPSDLLDNAQQFPIPQHPKLPSLLPMARVVLHSPVQVNATKYCLRIAFILHT